MPVYMFTIHAYQSWMPDHKRGYTKRGRVLPPDPHAAQRYRDRATQEPNLFDSVQQRVILSTIADFCHRRDYLFLGLGCEASHVHYIVAWSRRKHGFIPWREVRDRSKNLIGLMLGKYFGRRGRRWSARKASRKRVRDRGHLQHLLDVYLPKHSGVLWRKGDAPPADIEQMIADAVAAREAKSRGLPPRG